MNWEFIFKYLSISRRSSRDSYRVVRIHDGYRGGLGLCDCSGGRLCSCARCIRGGEYGGNRNALTNEQRRLFYNAVSKARKHLVVSYFAKAALELAEQSKMQVVRVRAEEQGSSGQEGSKGFASNRIAVVRPSMFLGEAGDACPGSMGGQALLAQFGLN